MNAMYIVIELRVPPESIGAAMVIIMSCCNAISGISPTLAYLPQPLPLFFMLAFLILIATIILVLPPAGMFLPKLEPQDYVDEKDVLVQSFALVNSINRDLHTSLLPLAGPAPSFMITYLERKSGVIRSRLLENKMDPNLSYDLRQMNPQQKRQFRQNQIAQKWQSNNSLL